MGYSIENRSDKNLPARVASLLCPASRGRPVAVRLIAGLLAVGIFLTPSFALRGQAAWGDFTIADEAELGKQIRMSVRSSFPLVEDPEVVTYINDLVSRLSVGVPPQPFPFVTNVIRHNAINAFAVPGGNLFIFTGLILAMEHESELAGVVAHEMAHATQRHIASRIKQMQAVSLLSLAGAIAGIFIGGNTGSALLTGTMAAGQSAMLNYSRSDETDADHVGMTYLVAGGFPPDGMVGAFEKIRRQQWLLGLDIPTYLSSHPGIGERISTLTARIGALTATVRNRDHDDRAFLRVQALIRGRYGDAEPSLAVFAAQEKAGGPQRCLAFMGKGILLSRLNRVNEARQAFDEAIRCGGTDSLIVREAGIFHYMKGDHALGARLIQQAVSMNRKDDMALFFHARVLLDNGNFREARRYLREILVRLSDDAEIHFYYAQALGKDNKMFDAYLHMAYSALYSADTKKIAPNLDKARALAVTAEDKAKIKRFEEMQKERRDILP